MWDRGYDRMLAEIKDRFGFEFAPHGGPTGSRSTAGARPGTFGLKRTGRRRRPGNPAKRKRLAALPNTTHHRSLRARRCPVACLSGFPSVAGGPRAARPGPCGP